MKKCWLVWKCPITRQRYTVGLLEKEDCFYRFSYINPELDEAIKNGFSYFPGFSDLKEVYESDKLFANISTRLPNKKRPDYLEILNSYDLDVTSDEFDILIATKGRLITDNYEFVPVFNFRKIEFEITGMSHAKDIEKCKDLLKENVSLVLNQEPENKYDKYAIQVILKKMGQEYHLGYVPRYYSKYLTDVLNDCISYSAMIEKVRIDPVLKEDNITVFVKLIFNK